MGKRRSPTKKSQRLFDRMVCERKQVYGTKHEADQTAHRMFRQGSDVHAYKCSSCDLWHVGHNKPRKKRRR